MGVGGNSNQTMNISLAGRKSRAAGRRNTASPEREAILDAGGIAPARGKTGGASGRGGQSNRKTNPSQGRGGGGGGGDPTSDLADVGRSSKRARTRKG